MICFCDRMKNIFGLDPQFLSEGTVFVTHNEPLSALLEFMIMR